MKNLKFLLFSIILILSGCIGHKSISPIDIETQYDEIAALCFKNTDQLTQLTEYTGPPYPDRLLETNIFLRAIRQEPYIATLYQAYILAYYKNDSFRDYNTGQDSKGNKLDLISLYKEVGNRTGYGSTSYYEEHLIINFSRKYLEAHKNSGLNINIRGTNGEEQVFMPGYYIAAFLNTVPSGEEGN